MKKVTLGLIAGGIGSVLIVILIMTNLSNNNEQAEQTEQKQKNEATTVSTSSVKEESEYEEQLKALVKNQFEYFDKFINGDYFINSRKNGPKADGTYPDDWMTKQVQDEFQQRATEIDEILPEELDSSDSTAQSLIQVLIRINQASSMFETQKNVYHIHKTLYDLHVKLNDYTLEEGKFDPEKDWELVFGDETELSVKSEAELEELIKEEKKE
ncbi:hypothetical protein [Metabacillus malikii]|uniref:Uncharacterized protein n=1 Tax=Metabacillus malikii TaxID=1504265 RepID=A0ABT9ZBD1_9BACI|nr:hypothetical protein [Metabacillus malikii]MDQ0229573.1 hypothetical protein [Metabacillus malikii]